MPAQYKLSLYRGDSFQYVFRFWQDQAKTIPADLTGRTPKATLTQDETDIDLPAVLTLPNEIAVTITGATWDAIPAVGFATWDLQLVDGAGWVQTPIVGPVWIEADITDAVEAAR
jgi:hypothetical protein